MDIISNAYSKKTNRKRRLQTTLSQDVFSLIEKYVEEYGAINAFIEEAIKFFDKYNSKQDLISNEYDSKYDKLLIDLKKEIGVVSLGKEAFNRLVEGNLQKAITENALEFAVEWYYAKPLKKVSLREAISAIIDFWIATNRISKAEVNYEENSITVIFHSNLNRASDEFFSKIIKHFLEKWYNVEVKIFLRCHGYLLEILRVST